MRVGRGCVLFFATGAGTGYAPVMPGTAGSAVGILVYILLAGLSPKLYIALVCLITMTAIWLSSVAAQLFSCNDPPQVVIDEICGMLVTLLGLPAVWYYVVAGFLLFRVFDVIKPFPANRINNRMHGGAGIVLDDIVAGIYANVVLHGIRYVIG